MNNPKKQLIALIMGVFLVGISYNAFGQITNTPSGNNITLDSKILYEHEYNSTGQDLSREAVDTVMVSSEMNYFVMPDTSYNKAYYLQSSYAATNLTTSEFVWAVGNGSSFAHQTANATSTSPWIKVTWGTTLGATTLTAKENPVGLPLTCNSIQTLIDIFVIAKPTIGFNQVGSPATYTSSDCYDASTVSSGVDFDFPITTTTSSTQLMVNVTVVRRDLNTNAILSTTPLTDIPVSAGAFRVNFTDYGKYEVEITQITDRIARKCDVKGDILGGRDMFTFSVMPPPQTGPIHHIPNNF